METRDTKCAAATAVAALGLVTTWSEGAMSTGSALNSTITITMNATVTVGITDGVSFFTRNSTITLDPPRKKSVGASIGAGLAGGSVSGLTVILQSYEDINGSSRSSFAGRIDNGDGTSDLVLAFAGDGSAAIGVAWTSLFVDNIPDDQRVFEPEVLAQLTSRPVLDQFGEVETGSQLDRLDEYYGSLLTSAWGETATLVAFSGAGNTGVAIGTMTITPAPGAAWAIGLGGVAATRRRRRAG